MKEEFKKIGIGASKLERELDKLFNLIPSYFEKSFYDYYCIKCGIFIKAESIPKNNLNDAKTIFCTKCTNKCILCDSPVLILKENEAAFCTLCQRKVCSNCLKTEELKKFLFECSVCKKTNICINCVNKHGKNAHNEILYCCKRCTLANTYQRKSKLENLKIVNERNWDFSKDKLEEKDIQNISYLLFNSRDVCTINLRDTCSFKSEEHFKSFMNAIRNHQSLKICYIELSFHTPPSTIFKLIESKLSEIIFLKSFTIRVTKVKENESLNFSDFINSFEFKCSPLNFHFFIEHGFEIDEEESFLIPQFLASKAYYYFLDFRNKMIKD